MRLASTLFFFAACSPELVDGLYGCPDGICPEGFYCGADLRCHTGAAPTVECIVDDHCADESSCTDGRCNEGRCEYVPVDGECDDGNFCNGRDVCIDGACVNASDARPPCADCDPMAAMPCECGPGDGCCDGGICFGALCRKDTCVACGEIGGPCCVGGTCPGIESRCVDNLCVHCGLMGEPCCGGRCAVGLECSNIDMTCQPPGACGGATCTPEEVCFGGTCTRCGGNGNPCCTGGSCGDERLACNLGSMLCEPCGGRMELCCTDTSGSGIVAECGDGFRCVMGRCSSCGSAPREPCCPVGTPGGRCDAAAGLACNDPIGMSYCVMCGIDGNPCCAGAFACGDPMMVDVTIACVAGTCRTDCGNPGQGCCPPGNCAEGYMCSGGSSGTCMPAL